MEIVHKSVLLNECLEYLKSDSESLMIDSTLGEGGHSFAFLSKFPELKIVGLDADSEIQERAKMRLSEFAQSGRMKFWNGWSGDFFKNYESHSDLTGGKKADLILFDLGISVFHYEKSMRGFSFRKDEKLDMRLDDSKGRSAADIVNSESEENLADLIYFNSDEKRSRAIARAICAARSLGRIESSKALAEIVASVFSEKERHSRINPATKTFQALRIAVNGELDNLPQMLMNAFSALKIGGKLGVITFHSIEDRIVKNIFRSLSKSCVCPQNQAVCTCGGEPCAELLTRKPVSPTDDEISENSPSRSAKLRVLKKIKDANEVRFSFCAK